MPRLSDIRIVFMGTPQFAVPSLNALVNAGARLVSVVTQPPRPAGRGGRLSPSAVALRAEELHLPICTPTSLRTERDRVFLTELRPDLFVVVAYGLILPKELVQPRRLAGQASEVGPMYGAVNIHASLLPRYRGAAPIPAAILAGDTETGVTMIKLDEGVDTGPILTQEAEFILSTDTSETLGERLATRGARLLVPTVERYVSGTLRPVLQDESRATRAPKLTKESGRIDWTRPAVEIDRVVRAYRPWPLAYTFWEDSQLTVLAARGSDEDFRPNVPPGTVLVSGPDVGVMTGDGVLWLSALQRAGGRPLPVQEFARGARGFVGSRLG